MHKKGLVSWFESDMYFGVWLMTRTVQYFETQYYYPFIATLLCIIIVLRYKHQDKDNELYQVYAHVLDKFPLNACYLADTDFKVDP